MKIKLYLCSANPQWGSASGGAVVRSAANKSIFANKFEHYKNNVRIVFEYIRWYKLGGQADMLKKAFVEALF